MIGAVLLLVMLFVYFGIFIKTTSKSTTSQPTSLGMQSAIDSHAGERATVGSEVKLDAGADDASFDVWADDVFVTSQSIVAIQAVDGELYPETFEYFGKYYTGTATLRPPVRPDKVFLGMYYRPTSNDKDSIQMYDYLMRPVGIYSWNDMGLEGVLYAKWDEYRYTIVFDKNGGSGGDDFVSTYEGQYPLSGIAPPTRTGYTFLGYSESATDPKKLVYGPNPQQGSLPIMYKNKGGTILYAVWKPQEYENVISLLEYSPENLGASNSTYVYTFDIPLMKQENLTAVFDQDLPEIPEFGYKTDEYGNKYFDDNTGKKKYIVGVFESQQEAGRMYYDNNLQPIIKFDESTLADMLDGSNIMLYVRYSADPFDVVLDNGYDLSLEENQDKGININVFQGQYPPLNISRPSRDSEMFLGYYDPYSNNSTNRKYIYDANMIRNDSVWEIPYSTASPYPLVSEWTAEYNTVTLDTDGGSSNITSFKAKKGFAIPNNLSIFTKNDIGIPTRSHTDAYGFIVHDTFLGYYDDDGVMVYDSNMKPVVYDAEMVDLQNNVLWDRDIDITLHARWLASKSTFRLDGNGVSLGIDKEFEVNFGDEVPDIKDFVDIPERDGYEFLGFYNTKYVIISNIDETTNNDMSIQYYGSNLEHKGFWNEYESDVTLYAVWKEEYYTLSFDLGYDNAQILPSYKLRYQDDFRKMVLVERDGYEFLGFFDEKGVQYVDAEFNTLKRFDKLSDKVTLYARWQKLDTGFNLMKILPGIAVGVGVIVLIGVFFIIRSKKKNSNRYSDY